MKYVSSLLCALLLCVTAHAAPPTKESIEKLLVVTEVEKMFGSMQLQIEAMMKSGMDQAFQGKVLSPESQQMVDSLRTKTMTDLKSELNWAQMKGLYTQVYSETFSQSEIDGLIAFYESPTGKAFVTKMPVVMQKSMMLMQQRMGPMVQRIQQSIQDASQKVDAAKK